MTTVVFMGTPQFAVPILQGLLDQKYDILCVVTQPDRPVGRKHRISQSPVKQAAVANHLPVFQPEKLSGSPEMQRVIDFHPDLIVTAAYGQFLPTKMLNAVKIAAVNVHGSLLPKYRGGAPVQYAIMNGDSETGISLIYMVKKMDAGDILAQKAVPIQPDDDTETMFDKLSIVGRDLLLATLPKVIAGDISPVPQDEDQVVFSPNIKPEEEQLDFNQTAFMVNAKVRALRPDPVAYTVINGKRTKIWGAQVVDQTTEMAPGSVVEKTKHQLLLSAGKGTVLSIQELQPAGKPKQQITDYLNGIGQSLKVGQQVIK
ncbi:methionyl-tRNA formyltransferase [Lentilactobacillus buchneri]|uniref:Methionyl-tRNA formyltransferase n=1 Tax=Lentilactobacillus buchneri subsp. silagei CD034 TaxID=1071400 RepID=J9W1N3_LENBU|nr:methionyl-tRNA formyltransferase [Lentilactobacillus buchneri]MCC6100229.1 methionyl-tRNA formyltransferase [Lactobacillus sp.]AFS00309.1 Methionyl-tRNA formyltransferase [Lentilactobacillus buchneri subsp. silagei CD034]MCT2900311.1 methionyl-tRNA formyltransferase [Lentilactobacillus buchneri]MCT3541935.1 methionyl-tRNA formyltransferase [Lentilactobacillus buchneri]MCT3545052.1 methionyl-tRNA formyltransferase [Lentilactobacillus buchneri]